MQTIIRHPKRHGKRILESVLNLDPPKASETDAVLAKATITRAVSRCAVIKARANLRVAAAKVSPWKQKYIKATANS